MPKIFKTISDVKDFISLYRLVNRRIGFVPTMGALHEGHLALGKKALKECDVVIYSIFVNPAQFGPSEDLDRYPRTLETDLEKLDSIGVDAVFLPDNDMIYPHGFSTYIELGDMENILCGRSRPGHFKGVATVVCKLFNITGCDQAYFGEKDMQQLIILKKMVRDLNIDIDIIGVETVRENDGLAMSSRNLYLTPEQRRAAPAIYRTLKFIKENAADYSSSPDLIDKASDIIRAEKEAEIEYIEIRNSNDLSIKEKPEPGKSVCFIAVKFGSTRLIDNIKI